jgi:hypothetical protein
MFLFQKKQFITNIIPSECTHFDKLLIVFYDKLWEKFNPFFSYNNSPDTRDIQKEFPISLRCFSCKKAADLLNVSGKVFLQKSQQSGGSPMIRGFETNRLLYTFD